MCVKSATSKDFKNKSMNRTADHVTHMSRSTKSQDGNLTSIRAIESYQKHLERQTARFERIIEAEEAEKRRPGSGNLWTSQIT